MVQNKKLRNYGEIYSLTSPIGKQYIGQCRILDSHYHKNGTQKRWSSHVLEARKFKHRGSWLLNYAIRKYGAHNFKVETILSCLAEYLNYYETYFIKLYNTLKPNGYNLVLGGGQYKAALFSPDKYRGKKKSDDVPDHIYYYDSGGCEGYRVEHPDLKTKAFLSSRYTMEEKLELSKKYLETGECHKGRLYVKRKKEEENDLPKYIKPCNGGYRIESPDKSKVFSNKIFTKEENLQMAKEYLETGSCMPPRKYHLRKNEEHIDLPKYIIRHRGGYAVQYYLGKKKKICKLFMSKKKTDEENLNLAKKFLGNLEKGIMPEKKEKKERELPKYICKIKNGYYVRHYPTNIRKSFISKDTSNEVLLERAKEYIKTLIQNPTE